MTASFEPAVDPAEHMRREALGAFAHEIRTPLTSIRMVLELARRQGTDGTSVLDVELDSMLDASVADLERLADDLQEFSRLERGRISLSNGSCDVAEAVAAAREVVAPGLRLAGTGGPGGLQGSWDAGRLVRALAGFIVAANRIGSGSGTVDIGWVETPKGVELLFASGEAGGADRPIGADAGFAFFRSRQYILAMGGRVECQRAERFIEIRVCLPRERAYTA